MHYESFVDFEPLIQEAVARNRNDSRLNHKKIKEDLFNELF